MSLNASNRMSASKATSHFRQQRITAAILIPTSLWLLVLMDKMLNAPYADTIAWISSPVSAAIGIIWIVAVFRHAALGVQVVLEDYVATIATRLWAIRAARLIFGLLGICASSAIVFILYSAGKYDLFL